MHLKSILCCLFPVLLLITLFSFPDPARSCAGSSLTNNAPCFPVLPPKDPCKKLGPPCSGAGNPPSNGPNNPNGPGIAAGEPNGRNNTPNPYKPYKPSPGGGCGGGGCGSAPPGTPVLSLSPYRASVMVADIPMAFNPARGPSFEFGMHYYNGDDRDRTNSAWPIGYCWSHNYEIHVAQTEATNYTLASGPYSIASFSWNGSNFVERFQFNYFNEFIMEWQGSNVVVRKSTWDSMAMSRPGSAPYMAWSAKEGWEFEPDGSGSSYRLLKQTGPCGLALTFDYTNNLLSHVTAADGNVFTFAYTNDNRISRITDPLGRTANFAYTNDMLASVSDMAGTTFLYGYYTNGWLTSLSRPGTNGWDTTSINYAGSYLGVMNVIAFYPEGNQSEMLWNGTMHDRRFDLGGEFEGTFQAYSWGRTLVESEDPDGRVTSYIYYDTTNLATKGKVKKEIGPDNTLSWYHYDSHGNINTTEYFNASTQLVSRTVRNRSYFDGTDCPQSETNQQQDAQGNVLSESVTTYERDDNGTPNNPIDDRYWLASELRKIDATHYAETRYIYNANGMMTEIRELIGPGANDFLTVQSFSYATNGLVSTVSDALTNAVHYTYDSANRIISSSTINHQPSTMTNTISYSYDDLDRITNLVHPDGISESWTMATCGCGAGTHVDRDGTKTTMIYDHNQRLKTRTVVSTNQTVLDYEAYTYEGANFIKEIADIQGNKGKRSYDQTGRLVSEFDKLDRETVYEYDAAGRQVLAIYPDGTVSSNTFDSIGLLIKTARYADQDAAAPLTWQEFGYDAASRRVTVKDALGNVTSNSHDLLSRGIKVTRPDGSFSETEFDLLGNVVKEIGPVSSGAGQGEKDAATTTFIYDSLNRRISMTDPLNRTTTFEYDPDHPQQTKYIRNANNQIVQETSYDLMGRVVTNISLGFKTVSEYAAAGRVVKTTFPDGSSSSNFFDGARLLRQMSRIGLITSYGFDALGRQVAVTNSRGNATLMAYDVVNNLLSATDPLSHVTAFSYDEMNRQIRTTLPDARVSSNSFDALGRLTAKTGAGGVPGFYSYDALSRMTQLKDGEGNKTLFSYDSLSRLTKKTYADGSHYDYAYNSRAWLTNRVDAMSRSTTYEYNNAGQLTKIDYPMDTDVTMQYDTLGRMTGRTDAAGTWNWSYEGESSRMLSESLTSVSSVVSVVNYSYSSSTFDLATMSFSVNGGPTNTVNYSWSNGRLTNISSALSATSAVNFAYSYLPNSDLLSGLTVAGAGGPGLSVVRSYNAADRLTSISNLYGSNIISSFAYTLDSCGRRIRCDRSDMSDTSYSYDPYDQLTSATKTNSPNAALDAAYNFLYQYDEVGNRLHEDRGLLDLDGTFNPLNQLTHLGFAGRLDIIGQVAGTNGPFSVKVDGESATLFNGTNFHGGGRVKAGTNVISIVSMDATTNRTESLRHVTMPPTNPQQFTWDLNGNMTSDSQRNFTWNEENKLVAVENVGAASTPRNKSEYKYDAQSRRVGKKEYSWSTNSESWLLTSESTFVYDGWLLVSEQSASGGNQVTNRYIWGLDLSGTIQGAGGVGGLLAVIRATTNGTAAYFPCYDGNGNISDYVDTNGVVMAHREYDPYGNTTVSTGPMKDAFNFWFSTKYYEPSWNLYYYGYRYYSPSLGRWLSRDPLGEKGFRYVLSSMNNNASTIPSSIIHGRSKLERPQLCQRIIDELHLDVFEGKNEEALIYSAYQYLSKMNFYISRLYSIGQGFQAQQLQYNAQQLEQYINWMRLQNLAEQKNLYAFVRNSPVDSLDLLGLMEATICMDKCDEVVEKTKMPCPDMWIKRCYSWCLMPNGPPPIPFPWPLP